MKRSGRKGRFLVYIVECKRGTFYTGYTNDLEKRLALHNSGKGAKYLRGKGPVKLLYVREYKYYKNAVKAEAAIKALTRKQKEDFIREHTMEHHKAEAILNVVKSGGSSCSS